MDASIYANKDESSNDCMCKYLMNIHSKIITLRESGELPVETIHLVLGNQSGDMDSISSAIAFSYAYSNKGFYVPVINIQKDELPLRCDVLYVLQTLNIDPNTLLYQEDLPFLLELAIKGYVRVTLMDHNCLAPHQEGFKHYVERIIDHHKDENTTYPLLIESEKIISYVGSNSTLVAEKILTFTPDTCSAQVAHLLLSAILLDTKDLKNKYVTHKKDIAVANILKEKAKDYYNNYLFEVLIKARNAIEHLTPELLLKKDYKFFKEGKLLYGIASIPKGVLWVAKNRDVWKDAFVQSLEKQKIHILCALAYHGDDRVFIVYIPTKPLQKAFIKHVRHTDALNRKFTLKSYYPYEGLLFYALKNPSSRKQIQPLFSFEKSSLIQHTVP